MVPKPEMTTVKIKVGVIPRIKTFEPKVQEICKATDGSIEDLRNKVNAELNILANQGFFSAVPILQEVLLWDLEIRAWKDVTLDVIDSMLPEGCR